jgi:hypothetical protein
MGRRRFACRYYKNAEGKAVESDKVAIWIDTQTWNGQTDMWRAGVLIHELGHIFNMLAGAGGSMFVYDVDVNSGIADGGAEGFNASLEKKCIH